MKSSRAEIEECFLISALSPEYPLSPTKDEPIIIGLDADIINDSFLMIAYSRHSSNPKSLSIRFAREWEAKSSLLDYQGTELEPGPERILRKICEQYNVVCVFYDPFQLHDFAMRLTREGIARFEKLDQGVYF